MIEHIDLIFHGLDIFACQVKLHNFVTKRIIK